MKKTATKKIVIKVAKKLSTPKKSKTSSSKDYTHKVNPFHLAVPVHDLKAAKKFYGDVLGMTEGRTSTKWQDYSLYGNQFVCHWVGKDYRCTDYFNPVDGDEVPVPHFGACLTSKEFDALAKRLKSKGMKFIIKPHLRFKGQRGEQKTMFFKD